MPCTELDEKHIIQEMNHVLLSTLRENRCTYFGLMCQTGEPYQTEGLYSYQTWNPSLGEAQGKQGEVRKSTGEEAGGYTVLQMSESNWQVKYNVGQHSTKQPEH